MQLTTQVRVFGASKMLASVSLVAALVLIASFAMTQGVRAFGDEAECCGDSGFSTDFGGWDSGFSTDFGGWDSGFASDFGGWDSGFSTDFGGWDSGFASDFGGWDSGFSTDFGGWDSGFSTDFGGWDSGFASDFGGWDSGFSTNFGGWDSGFPTDFGGWDSGFASDFGGWDSGLANNGLDSGLVGNGLDSGFANNGFDSGLAVTQPGYSVGQNGYATPVYGQGGSYSTPRTSVTPVYSSGRSYSGGGYSSGGGSRGGSYGGGYSAPRSSATPVYSAPRGYTVSTPTPYYPPVTPPTYRPTPTCTITASPSTVAYNGSATLVWSAQNATSAQLSGFGAVSTSGSRSTGPITGTRVYTLTVVGQGGSTSCSATVYAQPQQRVPSCTISASPNSVQQGGSTTLSWSSQNATSATLTDAGMVSTSGSRVMSALSTTKTYTLTVVGQGGTNACTVTVGVYSTPTPPPHQQMPTCTITASKTWVGYGEYTTLNWSSYNAISAHISTIGQVALSGARAVMPHGTMTYVMTVNGTNGTSNACSVTVNSHTNTYPPVYPPVYPPIYPVNPPVVYPPVITPPVVINPPVVVNPPVVTPPVGTSLWCSITAAPGTIRNGQSAILSWNSVGAVSAWLNDGLGKVVTTGSLSVRPESSRYYTLTVRDAYGNQRTCSANLTVSGTAQYVSLSSIPYTGLDFGPLGNALYWSALVALSLVAGYLAIGYKGGIGGAVMRLAHALHASRGERALRTEATVLSESIVAPARGAASTANEDIIADALLQKRTTTDTMTLEMDGDAPRLVIKRI